MRTPSVDLVTMLMGINNQAVQNKIKKVSEFDVFFMGIDATAG